jgi:hypothetical protein
VNQDTPSILVPADFGAPFEGGFYGGQISSHGGLKVFAVVWAPKVLGETEMIWLPSYKDVPNAASCFHSMDNTVAMAEAGSPLAQWARGLQINGHTDWCIPARDVLELGYRRLKPTDYENSCSFRDGDNPSSLPPGYPYTEQLPAQTAAAAFRKGGAEAFDPVWYWSSTQYSSSYAWYQYFGYGLQSYYGKEFEARARAVRMVQLNP